MRVGPGANIPTEIAQNTGAASVDESDADGVLGFKLGILGQSLGGCGLVLGTGAKAEANEEWPGQLGRAR